jgi:hypothetical protein
MEPKEITKHIGGVLCACPDCRRRKGDRVKKPIFSNRSDKMIIVEYELKKWANINDLTFYYEYVEVKPG